MALDPFIETQEDLAKLPEPIRAEYKPREDGKFYLDLNKKGGYELADTGGLLSALAKERTAKEEAARRAAEVSKRYEGVDVDKLKADAQRLAEIVAKGGTVDPKEIERGLAAEFERKQKALLDDHNRQLEAERTARTSLQSQLDGELLVGRATQAILEVDKGAEPRFLLPEIQRRTRVVERDGHRVVEVLDEAGQPRYKTHKGEAVLVTVADLVAELKSDRVWGRAFSAPAGGSGAGPSGGHVPAGENPFDRSSKAYSLTEQARLKRENPTEAARLEKLAGPPTRRPMIRPTGGGS